MNALEIKENRKRLKLTQEELGTLLGVSKRTIVNYEKGEVVPPTKRELLHKILLREVKDDNAEVKERDPFIDSLAEKLFGSELFIGKLKEVIKEEKADYTDEQYRELLLKMLDEVEKTKPK